MTSTVDAPSPPGDAGAWRSRILGTGEEDPSQLLANPRNWRIHPKSQGDALAEVLDRVGWVSPVIVNTTTGMVVDGHLRVALAIRREEPLVPVSYVELSEEEERLVIATYDPLAALAVTDPTALRELLDEVTINTDTLLAYLDGIAPPLLDDAAPGGFQSFGDHVETNQTCPKCGYEWHA